MKNNHSAIFFLAVLAMFAFIGEKPTFAAVARESLTVNVSGENASNVINILNPPSSSVPGFGAVVTTIADPSSGEVTSVTLLVGGSGYVKGEVLNILTKENVSGGATITVTSVNASGVITGLVLNPGNDSGYTSDFQAHLMPVNSDTFTCGYPNSNTCTGNFVGTKQVIITAKINQGESLNWVSGCSSIQTTANVSQCVVSFNNVTPAIVNIIYSKGIQTCQDLESINNNLSSNYQLINDIDCTDSKYWNGGKGFQPIGVNNEQNPIIYKSFTGSLDGQNHNIKNIFIDATIHTNVSMGTTSPIGLFSSIQGSTISNIHLSNAYVKGSGSTGLLAGQGNNNSINNVIVDGTVTGFWVGGLIGYSYLENITNSSAHVQATANNYASTVSSTTYLGGLLGYSQGDNISSSFSTGNLNNNGGASYLYTGGLVGDAVFNTVIQNSYSNASIEHNLNDSNYDFVGGLVGNFETYSSEIGALNQSYAAGLIHLTGTSSTASVATGGLIGQNTNIPVHNSYWDTQATHVDFSAGSPTSAGLTTVQMLLSSSYANWNFFYTWISDNQHYPILKWQEQPQISLWTVFSAASQPNVYELIYPETSSVNWTNINSFNYGYNWPDLLILSKPPVWNYPSAVPSAGYLTSVNWTDLSTFSNSAINWTDLNVLGHTGINWASANPLARSGINWDDWVVSTRSGINWNTLNLITHAGINWHNLGLSHDSVNWANLAVMSKKNINWKMLSSLTHTNTNWENLTNLNSIPIDQVDVHTLRTIGVNPNEFLPTAPVIGQISLNLNGTGIGTITSIPAGLNCTVLSPILHTGSCSSPFTLKQPMILNFSPKADSIVSYWGITGCATGQPTCTVTPDTDIIVNIMVNASHNITATASGEGTISPSGMVIVKYGSNQTYTLTSKPGYKIIQVLVDKVAVQLKNNSYTFNYVTAPHTISASFSVAVTQSVKKTSTTKS